MNLDINTTTQTAFFMAVIGSLLSLLLGIRAIQAGSKLMFFRKRQEYIARGWRYILVAIFLGVAAFLLRQYAEPVIYVFFKPSSTPSLTPTITVTPSITPTVTITLTPTITNTPSVSPSPFLSDEQIAKFTSKVTPNPNAVFSLPQFAQAIDKDKKPVNPTAIFNNPVGHLYGAFSYDKMISNSQWTALWVRIADKVVVCFDSKPWNGSTGGYGYSDCNPPANLWLPGNYEMEIFSGTVFMARSQFSVKGLPPTLTPTKIPTKTPFPSRTPSFTPVPSETNTVKPSPTSKS